MVGNNSSHFCCFHGACLRVTSGQVGAGNPELLAFSQYPHHKTVGVGFRDSSGVSTEAWCPEAPTAIRPPSGFFLLASSILSFHSESRLFRLIDL